MNSNTTGLILIIAAPKPPVNKTAKIVNKLEMHHLAGDRSVAVLRLKNLKQSEGQESE
jgi:hypothetical protein